MTYHTVATLLSVAYTKLVLAFLAPRIALRSAVGRKRTTVYSIQYILYSIEYIPHADDTQRRSDSDGRCTLVGVDRMGGAPL